MKYNHAGALACKIMETMVGNRGCVARRNRLELSQFACEQLARGGFRKQVSADDWGKSTRAGHLDKEK